MQLFLIPLLPIRPCAFDPNLREAGTQKGLLLLTRLPSSALKWTSVFAAKGFQRYFRFLFFSRVCLFYRKNGPLEIRAGSRNGRFALTNERLQKMERKGERKQVAGCIMENHFGFLFKCFLPSSFLSNHYIYTRPQFYFCFPSLSQTVVSPRG